MTTTTTTPEPPQQYDRTSLPGGPLLTIGMAQYDDWESTYWTLQALRHYHDLRDCELLVIDSSRDCPRSREMAKCVQEDMHLRGNHGARWLKYTGVPGTSGPKNEVFAQANGRFVLCIDPHVLMRLGSICALIDLIKKYPNSPDIYQGPVIAEDGQHSSHCFVDIWRGPMWGVWADIWKHLPTNCLFACYEDQGKCKFASLRMYPDNQIDAHLENILAARGIISGEMSWGQHELALRQANCQVFGQHAMDESLVPGMGMGMFCMRKDAWPGFNPDFRGFGGEELYLHEKVRRAGGQCRVLNRMPWMHKFRRLGPVKYPNRTYDKVRNFVIGHQELGLDMNRMDEHVHRAALLPEGWYEYLCADPIGRVNHPGPEVQLTGTC